MKNSEEPLIIDMQVTGYMLNLLKETLNIEIDLLQGSVQKMPDGRFACHIEVDGYKKEMFLEFMKICVANPKTDTSYMGLKINPN